MSEDIGSLQVNFDVNLSSLTSGIDSAKEKIASVGPAAEDAGNRTGGGFMSAVGGVLDFGSKLFLTAQGIKGFADTAIGAVQGLIEPAEEAQQTMSQTQQVLKSTGDASGETAQQIYNLADKFSKITPYSRDATQGAENLLLTFTNIGQKVFPQATQAILDVSTVMHQDLQSSTVQIGKALNDPIQGITALTRIGVTFSDQEKEQIKTMVAHNDVIGAQKIILGELNKEFGGQAVNAGKQFAGQMEIMGNKLEDVKEKIGTALMPVLSQLFNIFDQDILPDLEQVGGWLSGTGIPAFQQFASTVADNVTHNGDLRDVLSDVDTFLQTVGSDLQQNVLPPLESLVSNVLTAASRFGDWLDKSGTLKNTLSNLGDTIGTVSSVAGTLVGWVSDLIGWFTSGGPQTYILAGAVGVLGAAFVGLKIADTVQGFANMFGKLQEGEGLVSNLANSLQNKLLTQFPNLKKALADTKTQADDTGNSLKDIGTKAETGAGEVATAAKAEEGDLAAVGGAASNAATEVKSVGAAAEGDAGEVATASAEMEASLKGVGTVATATATSEDAIGAQAEAQVPVVEGASSSMSGSLAGVLSDLSGIFLFLPVIQEQIQLLMDIAQHPQQTAHNVQSVGYRGGKSWNTNPGPNVTPPEEPGGASNSGAGGPPQNGRGFASGGRDIPAGWSIVGENGPEPIYVPGGADIYSHGSFPTPAMYGAMMPAINLTQEHHHHIYIDGHEMTDYIGQHMLKMIYAAGPVSRAR